MKPWLPRAAALLAVLALPVLSLFAAVFAATWPTGGSIGRGPLEAGEKIGRSRAWLEYSGFFPAELADGRSFSWMGETGRIRLSRLNRASAHTLVLWVQPAVTNRAVELIAAVDGLALPPAPLVPGPQRIDVRIPPGSSPRAIVTLGVSGTLVPGGGDTRTLGLRIDGVALEAPDRGFPLAAESVREGLLAALSVGLAIALTLGARPLAWALAAGAGSWLGLLLTFDGAFLGSYPDRLQLVGLGTAVIAAVATAATRGSAREPWGYRAVIGVLVVFTACKLALFVHPMAAVGDSIFHVHRAQVVQRGEYFFTSITPRPFFEFPYPPGLYVAVGPLWDSVRGDIEHVWLLRSAVLTAEAALGLAIYAAVTINWRNRLAAFVAAALTVLLPVGLYTACTSNLTNGFGQSLFGIGLAVLVCAPAAARRRWLAIGIGSAFVGAGFLSHFSTFSIGIPLLAAASACAWLGGPGAPRRASVALALALAVSTSVSVAVYYSHFVPVYRQTVERVLAREGADLDRSMVAPVGVKARRVATTIWTEFGAVVLGAAAAGLLLVARGRDPLTLALAGWAVVVGAFWLLAIFTAIEMRASLAAQGLIAILAGLALARAAQDGRWGRAAAAAAGAAVVLHAMSDWVGCLGSTGFWRI